MQHNLTARETENARDLALKTMRQRLESRKPDPSQYATASSRASDIIAATLVWSKATVPFIALLAALASAVRTVQVVSTIYSDAGSHAIGILIASVAFTLSAEGALFVLALAQAGEQMKRRAEKRTRHVASLRRAWEGVLVRVGIIEPRRWDELPEESGNLGLVIALALVFTLSTNLYLGLKPLIDQIGASSLQDFVGSLWQAPASVQMTAIVDLSAALFAPLVAFAAGHLTAHFAAEVAQATQAARRAYERDLEAWRSAYTDPLQTDEGRELLTEYISQKAEVKAARAARQVEIKPVNPTPLATELPTPAYSEGHAYQNGHSYATE